MGETLRDPVIKKCCEAPNRLKELQNISDGLEKCQKSLNDYLDSKRNAFPRFFFISDDELLSILGSSDPLCVQEHMIKVQEHGEDQGAGACKQCVGAWGAQWRGRSLESTGDGSTESMWGVGARSR